MSSPDPLRHSRKLAVLAALAAPLAVAGCQVRPLYATTAVEAGPQADLPAIDVESPAGRFEQSYRNALLFALRGGGAGTTARYTLSFRITARTQGLAVERTVGTPNLYQITGALSFLLKDATTGESLFGTSVLANDSYTRSSQSFANIRAERDAEDRLASQLATLTQARLAAYFATR